MFAYKKVNVACTQNVRIHIIYFVSWYVFELNKIPFDTLGQICHLLIQALIPPLSNFTISTISVSHTYANLVNLVTMLILMYKVFVFVFFFGS